MTSAALEERPPCIIIGAGPAGLTAACELARLGVPALVLEQDSVVGGIARTVEHQGYRFDIGGHRFFTKVPWVQAWWQEVLAEDFLVRPRLSRIFYEGRFFDYPLKPLNALRGLGPAEALRIAASFAWARLRPAPEEPDFERWVSNRFGRRLYEIFFKTYTEKVWGMPCSEIRSDWAAQRIRNLDLVTVVRNAFLGESRRDGEVVTTLIERFHYPRLGPGMMWERARALAESKGVPTLTGMEVWRLHVRDGRVEAVTARDASGSLRRFEASHVVSSMPIRDLVERIDPPPPAKVCEAGARLRYRDFLTVGLMLDCPDPFPDNWIYVHSPEVRVGRIQNFGRWSPEMVPSPGRSSLGLEYFVQEGDELWSLPDEELVALARRESEALGLVRGEQVIGGTVIRVPKAYPVYDAAYRESLDAVRRYLEGIGNLQLVGRNGQHRYNNQDHSMVTAAYAAQNLAGASHDVWDVNVDDEYHEEVASSRGGAGATGERLVPLRLDAALSAAVLRRAFARYDAVALGGAVGLVGGLGLFLATVALVVAGGEPLGPNLALLGNYLPGFTVSWGGAVLGLVEAGAGGFALGYLLAQVINAAVSLQERVLLRRIARSQLLRAPEEST